MKSSRWRRHTKVDLIEPGEAWRCAGEQRRFLIVIALAGIVFAQSSTPVIGMAGYSAPVPLTVAPGQLVTLFVPGFGSVVSGLVKAPSGPFPNKLAGVSAVFRQGSDQPSPIFEVQPIKACTALDPPANSCGSILAVTVQIPFNIQTVCPLCLRPISLIPSQIAISVNGVQGQFSDVTAVADQVRRHALRSTPAGEGVSSDGRPHGRRR